ncbi:hypothetical protein K7X08_011864 [Anisodus acutangulus]|uniref:Uncharacterized protein n=1 Tax=Anisodus acutangulus TaxID=402998 RepID=A0A9Q1LC18_9SOLA|nr:hypothetical protein K7X08_011864 [Anisodus acutangulus]
MTKIASVEGEIEIEDRVNLVGSSDRIESGEKPMGNKQCLEEEKADGLKCAGTKEDSPLSNVHVPMEQVERPVTTAELDVPPKHSSHLNSSMNGVDETG